MFAWAELAQSVTRVKGQKAPCQTSLRLPLTDDRQHRLAFSDEGQTDGGQQPSADACLVAYD